ncbi:MAG: Sigma-70, region 4, partial [Hyphomicrobiales bacterium]|nr:Sigma-70, region 4 [Hyphomicrobiales bacterium]
PPRPADAPVARLVRPAAASGGAASERAPAGGAAQTARALASLTPRERAALLLVVVEGFRYAEAASALRIEPDAVPALLAQGRARLAARLGMCKPPARPALRLVE